MKDDLIFALSNSKEVELFKAWDNMDEDGGMVSIDYDDYTEILDENANDRRWNESGGMVEIHSDCDWYCVILKNIWMMPLIRILINVLFLLSV